MFFLCIQHQTPRIMYPIHQKIESFIRQLKYMHTVEYSLAALPGITMSQRHCFVSDRINSKASDFFRLEPDSMVNQKERKQKNTIDVKSRRAGKMLLFPLMLVSFIFLEIIRIFKEKNHSVTPYQGNENSYKKKID